jgi:hypothetical protein
MRHIVITTILGLVSVLIGPIIRTGARCSMGRHCRHGRQPKWSFTFSAPNQYAQASMHPSSTPTVMPKGFFPARARSVSRNVPRWEGLTRGGAAVMAPTPLPAAQGTMSGHPQLLPLAK